MSGIYYADLLDVLRAAGCQVAENATTAGWQTRARSSGGFPAAPLCVFWHHTASSTTPENDLHYMITSADAPIGNMLIDRNGVCWPIAAGASNCAGKGGPSTFSRGTIPIDQGNTRGWQIECQNTGVGEAWSTATIDALFRATNALNARFGNVPADVITHALGAGDGYTSRKIDPAVAAAVEGTWKPRSTNSSGTWSLADIRNECAARAAGPPIPPDPIPPDPTPPDPVPPDPTPQPPPEDWMAKLPTIKKGDRGDYVERMQHLLAAAGFMNPANTANYDGVWGNGTENAKVAFDNAHGLTPSPPSDCGPKSWESLMTGRKW